MKRLLVFIIVLVLLAATAFAFGYVQLRIDAGQTAVLFSRTSGWDPTVHRAGDLAWRWQLLIPRNATVFLFPLENRRVQVESRAFLPSADLYAQVLEGAPSLDHEVDLSVVYRPRPEAPSSLAPHGITPDEFDDWLADQDEVIASSAIDAITNAANRGIHGPSGLAGEVESTLGARHPQLEVISVRVVRYSAPDLALYEQARETYLDIESARRDALATQASVRALEESRTESQVDLLRRYGAILDEYPVLLEYVRISAETGVDPLEIGFPDDLPVTTP